MNILVIGKIMQKYISWFQILILKIVAVFVWSTGSRTN